MRQHPGIQALREQIGTIRTPPAEVLETAVGPLRCGALHEWFGIEALGGVGTVESGGGFERNAARGSVREGWVPPLCILCDVARRAISVEGRRFQVVWIGRRCWPSPLALGRWSGLIERSVFVDPPDFGARWWAADVACRCGQPTLVIADGSRCSRSDSRRLQLAASSAGAVCILARPPWEVRELSTATTRWSVAYEPSDSGRRPRWAVVQLRNKDQRAFAEESARVVVELDHASGLVRVSPPVVDRAVGEAACEDQRTRRAAC